MGCGRCDDWFHGECVGLDLAKAQQMEKEDQEYVCLKCCAEEDKKVESEDHGAASVERQVKVEQAQENKPAVRYEKMSHQPSAAAVRKASEPVGHAVFHTARLRGPRGFSLMDHGCTLVWR